MALNVGETLQQAVALHQQAQLLEAEKLYQAILEQEPLHFDALHLLGVLECQRGNYVVGTQRIEQALQVRPHAFHALVNLGSSFEQMGQLSEAVQHYQQALAIQPTHIETVNKLAAVLATQNRWQEAEKLFDQVIAITPEDAGAHYNLGSLFALQSELSQAQTCYQKALFIKPDYAQAHNSLGATFHEQGRFVEAARCFQQAIDLQPVFTSALSNLGTTFSEQGKLDEAISCYEKVLSIEPANVEAWNNLALVLQAQGQFDKSIACFQHVPQSDVDNVVHQLQHICDWEKMDFHISNIKRLLSSPEKFSKNSLSPFRLLSLSGITSAEQLQCAQQFTRSKFKVQLNQANQIKFEYKKISNKIKVGYFSADFKEHPVSQLMAEVFELHDRQHFETFGYSYGVDDGSAMRQRIEKAFDHFVDIRDLSYEQAAHKINDDGIHILVDLTGYTHTARSGVLALRPAPIQVNYLGFLGTMGADFMDYIIADEFLIPPSYQQFYTEKVAYLPSYQANDRQCNVAVPLTRTSYGLPEKAIVFCSFNQTYKITPAIFDVWMKLLNNVQNSVLWLFASNSQAASNLQKYAQSKGVDLTRIIFAEKLPLDQHLARLTCADLFLDTMPYNAGTTASNALWIGLPVITCAGETLPSRMAGSLLTALGVPELITYNMDDYYTLAFELAVNDKKRQTIRNKIITNKETALLFDSERFTRSLEDLYVRLCK